MEAGCCCHVLRKLQGAFCVCILGRNRGVAAIGCMPLMFLRN